MGKNKKRPKRVVPIIEPELLRKEDSEIEALIDLTTVGSDGVSRPIFINQFEEEVLALTLEDADRLFDFLDKAIVYVRDHRKQITQ